MKRPGTWTGIVWLALTLLVSACGAATRAEVHEEDWKKVFPWPRSQQEVKVRAKPLTTTANTCIWFGSFEEVVVTPDITFFITDELEKEFAYTPARSPVRRLAPVKFMEIRWPIRGPAKEESPPSGEQSDKAPDKASGQPDQPSEQVDGE